MTLNQKKAGRLSSRRLTVQLDVSTLTLARARAQGGSIVID